MNVTPTNRPKAEGDGPTMTPPELSHVDKAGRARMVDVSAKPTTVRTARAEARVQLGEALARRLQETGGVEKGPVLPTARIAGILAAKKTADLIPMCHPLALDHVELDFAFEGDVLRIEAEARCQGRTGVEMEAMTAVMVAALTVYDMCKSANKGIVIQQARLLEKTGGKSGRWTSEPSQ